MGAYSPLAIANWFLRYAAQQGQKLDPMKLIKLVYLGHGWHLAVRGEALINENVEAWQYGPVIPSVYHTFKRFGAKPIVGYGSEVSGGRVEVPTVVQGDTETTDVLERVWDVYGGFTGVELSNLTHQPGSPWDVTWKKAVQEQKTRGRDISDDLIQRHFIGIAEGSDAGSG